MQHAPVTRLRVGPEQKAVLQEEYDRLIAEHEDVESPELRRALTDRIVRIEQVILGAFA